MTIFSVSSFRFGIGVARLGMDDYHLHVITNKVAAEQGVVPNTCERGEKRAADERRGLACQKSYKSFLYEC